MSKAKKIIICFLGCLLVAFSGFTALASSYSISIAQPQIDEYSGYLEIITSKWGACVVYFRAYKHDGSSFSSSVSFSAQVVDNRLAIFVDYPDTSNQLWVTGVLTNANGYIAPLQTNQYYASITLGNSGNITNVNAYNCSLDSSLLHNGPFTFVYGSDSIAIAKLEQIYSAVNSLGGNLSSSINSNADKNASEIQANDDKNTQSIIDNQNQLAEQEKTETQNSGNNSINDVSGSVPDKSAGMLSALQSLSNAVSYTGTVATWKFPQMYIPAIAGVTDRINLNPEMQINFTYWVNKIPQDIRTVISALATIGLVVFAFKELYGLISYVLTLKGGGNNE